MAYTVRVAFYTPEGSQFNIGTYDFATKKSALEYAAERVADIRGESGGNLASYIGWVTERVPGGHQAKSADVAVYDSADGEYIWHRTLHYRIGFTPDGQEA